MKRKYSVKSKLLFEEIFTKGKKIQEKGVQLYYKRRTDAGSSNGSEPPRRTIQIGIAVSKRLGTAVVRNRIKRKIRAIMNEFLNDMNNNYILIIKPTYNIRTMAFDSVKRAIKSLLLKAGALK